MAKETQVRRTDAGEQQFDVAMWLRVERKPLMATASQRGAYRQTGPRLRQPASANHRRSRLSVHVGDECWTNPQEFPSFAAHSNENDETSDRPSAASRLCLHVPGTRYMHQGKAPIPSHPIPTPEPKAWRGHQVSHCPVSTHPPLRLQRDHSSWPPTMDFRGMTRFVPDVTFA